MAVFALLFAIIPSITLGGSDTLLVLGLTLVPLAAFAVGERLTERRRPHLLRAAESRFRVRALISLAAACSATGHLLSIRYGLGSVSEVVAGYQYSNLGSGARVLESLTGFSVVMSAYGEFFGYITRKTAWLVTALVLGLALLASLAAGYLGGATAYLTTFLVVGSLTRLVRPRHIIAGIGAVVLLLPALFKMRDTVREGVGLGRSSLVVGPFERFRVDTLMTLLNGSYPKEWVNVPDLALLVRTALVPRFLDPERPVIDIGQQINYALGNTNLNNATFGHYGTVYWLYGWLGIVTVAFLLGGLFGLGVRWYSHLMGSVLLVSVAYPAVWPETPFPAYWVGMIQLWILLALLYVAVVFLEALRGKARPAHRVSGWPTKKSVAF